MRRLTRCAAGLAAILALAGAGPVDLELSVSPVADAAEAGDAETVRALLRDGADVNAAQGDGMTALHWAASHRDTDLLDALLHAGANVHASTRLGGFRPILLAAKSGHPGALLRLLEAGADSNAATSTGASALMLAAASGSTEAVRTLIDGGADIHARENTGSQTALMFAAAADRSDVIDLLIAEGADPSATTEVVDAVALNQALDEGFRQRIDDLREAREKAAAESADGEAVAATSEAETEAKKGKSFFRKLFGWMLPSGNDENEPPPRRARESYGVRVGAQGGMTALLLAARQGHVDSVESLLRAGADVNQVASGSRTSPLLIATMNGQFDLAKKLLERGADPTLAGEPARVTPLYAVLNLAWAPRAAYPQPIAQKQQEVTHLDLMKALLDRGADPNVRLAKKVWFMGYNFDRSSIDEIGATPFWRAAYGSDVAAMKLLRAYGADVSIPTTIPSERPPVASSRARETKSSGGDKRAAKVGPGMSPLHGATGAGYGEGFAANDHRNHPAGFMPAVRYLVEECGADVNALDHDGSTPLHNAAARGDVEMIEYLVSKGADVTIINAEGRSTADMANGPVQRVNPFPEARDLLVRLGAVNHDNCVSC